MKKYITLPFILAAITICSLFNLQFLPQKASAASIESINPYTNDTTWHFKTENGKLYKRLYDNIKNKWIGDWILVS